jgi:predicted nucleic acid-binding protein
MASTPVLPVQWDQRVDAAPPAVVLDTNAVLDWLVFRHPSCALWSSRFADGSVRWLADEAVRAELCHVLDRGVGSSAAPDLPSLWRTWGRWATPVAPQVPAGPAGRMRCTDADDQKFIDLAFAHGARWLISRDRAVLKLARRARPLGLQILTPEGWEAALSADPMR